MKPYRKNHIVIKQAQSFIDLWKMLSRRKSIYFEPADRVIPTKFFLGFIWNIDILTAYAEAGAFWEVERKDERVRRRIRKALSDCSCYIKFDNGSRMAYNPKAEKVKSSSDISSIYF
jgi:hypothetical protein